MAVWFCKECGCESEETSDRCEICDAPRETAGVATYAEVPRAEAHATFELDGQPVAYATKKESTSNPLGPVNADIARIKKEAGL